MIDHYVFTILDVNFTVSKYAHSEAKLLNNIAPGYNGCC